MAPPAAASSQRWCSMTFAMSRSTCVTLGRAKTTVGRGPDSEAAAQPAQAGVALSQPRLARCECYRGGCRCIDWTQTRSGGCPLWRLRRRAGCSATRLATGSVRVTEACHRPGVPPQNVRALVARYGGVQCRLPPPLAGLCLPARNPSAAIRIAGPLRSVALRHATWQITAHVAGPALTAGRDESP